MRSQSIGREFGASAPESADAADLGSGGRQWMEAELAAPVDLKSAAIKAAELADATDSKSAAPVEAAESADAGDLKSLLHP